MKLIRFYSGKFNPYVDVPVDPDNKALTIDRFLKLPIDTQYQILQQGRATAGYHGSDNPEPNYVPPFCRHGITLPELQRLYDSADESIKRGLGRFKDDKTFRESLAKSTTTQTPPPNNA